MDSPVITYVPPKESIKVDEKEVYRYLGYSIQQAGEADAALVREVIPLVKNVMEPKACYSRYAVEVKGDGKIVLPYGEIVSHDLTRNLNNCSEIYFFAATIGTGFDRLLRRVRIESMGKAAILQAAGAAAVEGLCDRLNYDLAQAVEAEGHKTRPRYSPGYGDYPLENQKGIFSLLQPSRYIGLSLMDTLIMAPEKSVTAVIGIEHIENK